MNEEDKKLNAALLEKVTKNIYFFIVCRKTYYLLIIN